MHYGVDMVYLTAYGAFVLYGLVGYFVGEFNVMQWDKDWSIS